MGEWFVHVFISKNLGAAMFKLLEIEEYNSDVRHYN